MEREREDDEATDEIVDPDDDALTSEDRKEEAMRPLVEAGEGESEGFEEAERELIEHASHGDKSPDPTDLAGEPEAERSDAEYAEADEIESTEVRDESDQ